MRRGAILAIAAALLVLPAGCGNEQPSPPPPQAAQAPPAPLTPPVDLGQVLGLGSLAGCAPSPALASILEQMVRSDPETFESRRGGAIRVPGHAQPLTPTFERTRETEGSADIRAVAADLDFAGRWHGLAVLGLTRSFYEESDASAFQVRFAEPPERVRETLIRHGFRLPAVGEMREFDDEGLATYIGIERIEGGAGLTCATG